MSSVMPSASNYAEQVLREEAERLRQINEKKSEEATYANASSMSEANFNQIHTKSAAKVNLNDEKDFPTLGNAKGIPSFNVIFNLLVLQLMLLYGLIRLHLYRLQRLNLLARPHLVPPHQCVFFSLKNTKEKMPICRQLSILFVLVL